MTLFSGLFKKQPNKFRFSLITDFVNVDILPNAPKGWDGSLINWGRSDTYFGMMRTFTVPMSFVMDGAWILRTEFYKHFVFANVQFRVEKFNPTTWNYDIVYQGDNDFSQFKDQGSEAGDIVTINVMESGVTRIVKAYESVKYTIPLTTANATTINLTPIKLSERADFIFPPYTDAVEDGFVGLQLVNNDQKATVNSVQTVANRPAPPASYTGLNDWFYQATVNTTLNIVGKNIAGNFGNAGNPDVPIIDISIYNQNGTKLYNMYSATGVDVNFAINFNVNIPVNAGDRLFMFTTFTGHGKMNLVDGDMSLKYNTISPETTCLGVTGKYLFEQLMFNMNGQLPVVCQSFYLDSWANLLFTSGSSIKPYTPIPIYAGDGGLIDGTIYFVFTDAIKYNGVTHLPNTSFTANANPDFTSVNPNAYVMQLAASQNIIISWSDFFQSINAMLGVGWGVQNGVSVLEKKSYFYQPTLSVIDVGRVKTFSLSASTTFQYSSLKVGFADQTYDQLNGANEVNSTQYYTLPNNRVNLELDLTSSIRGDSIGAELLRVGLSQDSAGASSTASNNDVWAIYTKTVAGVTRPVPASDYTSVSGITTNVWNLEISPKANLLRHSDFLAGLCDKLTGENITFTSGLKNVSLTRLDAGQRIAESANVSIATLGAGLFLPYEVDITIKEPINMLEMVDKYPTGCVKFNTDGVDLTIFIKDCNTDINSNKPQTLKGYITPNNNLLNLIR